MPELTIEDYKKKVAVLEQKLAAFEMPGKVKLFYSLNRNMNDLADMLNAIKLKDLNLDDPKDKTFERLKIIWASITPLATTIASLGATAGITGNEEKDIENRVPFIETIAQRRD